jgi:hypothetical protein
MFEYDKITDVKPLAFDEYCRFDTSAFSRDLLGA